MRPENRETRTTEGKTPSAPNPSANDSSLPDRMRILVVDDNPTNRKLLKLLLEAEGHSVIEADNGISALERLDREQLDAVISDILMPEMDGYRLSYEIRKSPKFSHIPFIVYTASYTLPADEKLALQLGVDKFIRKPATGDDILKNLYEVVVAANGRERKDLEKPEEAEVMREYSQVLVRKLEQTIVDLSEANRNLAERTALAEFVAAVSTALSEAHGIREMLQRCCDVMVSHLEAAFARIWTVNEKENVLELQASSGMYTHIDGGHARIPVGEFKIGLIASERAPHMTNSVIGDPRVHDQAWARREGMVAFAGYPLMIGDQLVGVMAVFARKPLSKNTFEVMGTVAQSIAVGVRRQLAEGEVHSSEERFRELAENINEVFFVISSDASAMHYVSPAYETVFGRKKENLYQDPRDWLDAVHPDDRQRVAKTYQSHPENFDDEYRIVRPDGQLRWIYARSFPVKDSAGKLVRSVGLAEDITARKRAEEKVNENLKRIRALHEIDTAISSSVDLRTVLNVLLEKIEIFLPIAAATTVRLLNQRTGGVESLACRGLDENEWTSQQHKILAGRAKTIVETKAPVAVRDIQNDAPTYNAEIFGKYGLVSYLGVPLIAKETVLGVLGLYTKEEHEFSDEDVEFLVTVAGQAAIAIHNAQLFEETALSKKELETTNQYLERSLQQLGGLYAAMTPLTASESFVGMVNEIIARLMEATGADAALIRLWHTNDGTYPVIGQRGYAPGFIEQITPNQNAGAVGWVMAHGEPIIAPIIATDGRLRGKRQMKFGFQSCAFLPLTVQGAVRGVIQLSSRTLRYFDEEQKDHFMAVARQMSITLENREMYYNLQTSRNELERANNVKDDFLNVMSHELRTPLSVVTGYSAMLRQQQLGPLTGEQEHALNVIQRNSQELRTMIDSIMDATKIETGSMVTEIEPVSLPQLLGDIKVGYDCPNAKNIRLQWNFSDALPPLWTDARKLRQILTNLVNNAIKFTDEGSVVISADEKIEAETGGHRQWIEFRIADSGIGIPPEAREKIFERFHQVDGSGTRSFEGVGIGLYIVKSFTEMLGGQVSVESVVGKGSTFTVSVPLRIAPKGGSTPPSPPPPD